MPDRHILECRSISYMTAISTNSSWLSNIYKPPTVFQILKNVTFTAISGEIHAIVGVADSGKSTLLEALTSGAGGDIGGMAMLNKFMLTKRRFDKYCSFVNYKTNFPSSLIVRTLFYQHAKLYLSASLTNLEIDHRITDLMGIFDILGYRNESLENLTISAKRRVLTVLELLKDPSVVLIDDPTVDIPPLSSYQLIYALQYYAAKYNRIVIITLRNVRSDLYHLLGSVTFLYYGEVAYTGETKNLLTYFKKAGFECPINENPAAYYLTLLTIDKESMERILETQETAVQLVQYRKEQKVLSESLSSTSTAGVALLDSVFCANKSSISDVVTILFRRLISLLILDPSTTFASFISIPLAALPLSFLHFQVKFTPLFFWKIVVFIFLILQTISIFPIYSKVRYFSFFELPVYSQSVNLSIFFTFFLLFSGFHSFVFSGVILWFTNFESWLDISLIFWILSLYNFSIFSVVSRYLKSSSNVFIAVFTVLLYFFVAGNGITRLPQQTTFHQYLSMINPFTYSNFLLSLKTGTSIKNCTAPKYICSVFSTLHSDMYPTSHIPHDYFSNSIILLALSLTYCAISLFIHCIEPSIQLQKHMKYHRN